MNMNVTMGLDVFVMTRYDYTSYFWNISSCIFRVGIKEIIKLWGLNR